MRALLRFPLLCRFGLLLIASSAHADARKPPLSGLVSMGFIGFIHGSATPENHLDAVASRPSVFDGVAINVAWDELQPEPGELATASIDQALSEVLAYNRNHPDRMLGVQLRVFASGRAPNWAKALAGGPVTVFDRQKIAITIGRFWTLPFQAAWARLQQQLALRYDNNMLIREVSVTSCTSRADEPLVLPGDDASLRNLHEAGFTDAAYKQCLLSAVPFYERVWRNTYIDFAVNTFKSTDTERREDSAFTEQLVTSFRDTLGSRGALSHHGLAYPLRPNQQQLYNTMLRQHQAIELQMFSATTDDWEAAMTYAVTNLHPAVVELWPPFGRHLGFEAFDQATLVKWSDEIKAGSAVR